MPFSPSDNEGAPFTPAELVVFELESLVLRQILSAINQLLPGAPGAGFALEAFDSPFPSLGANPRQGPLRPDNSPIPGKNSRHHQTLTP